MSTGRMSGITAKPDDPATLIASIPFHRRFYAFIHLGRPLFLIGGVILYALGTVAALYSGAVFNGPVFIVGQVGITAIQWMTHYSNDYFDQEADRANRTPTRWSGGSRVLISQLVPSYLALITALTFAGVAFAVMVILSLFMQTGPLTLPLFSLALFLAWFYSAPPLRFHSRGFGEGLSAVLVAGLTPLTGYYLQRGQLDLLPLLIGLPLIGLQFCMLLTVAFPDAAGDAAVGKRTLVVRLGIRQAIGLHHTVLALVYLVLPVLVLAGLPVVVALLAVVTLPLAIWQIRVYNAVHLNTENHSSFISVALLMGTALAETAALLLLIGLHP